MECHFLRDYSDEDKNTVWEAGWTLGNSYEKDMER
jgi:hypothetical protein